MKKKGFTLVELLVVIAIIALLMGILMPALARVRMIAYRMVCGSNLSGIGKALLLYAGDAQESYPMPGNSNAIAVYSDQWGISSFDGSATSGPFGTLDKASIGSIFYMLIKYEDVAAKQFNCKGDSGSEVFKISSYSGTGPGKTTQTDVTKLFDFGPNGKPGKHNSYAYHNPFGRSATSASTSAGFPVSVNSKPNAPLAGDRNPGMDKNAAAYLVGGTTPGGTIAVGTTADIPYRVWGTGNPVINEYKDKDFIYNAYAHQREGQNVLYNDGHVRFESATNVGIDNDNIYQRMLIPPNFVSSTTPKPSSPKEREAGGYFPAANTTTPPTFGTYEQYIPADSEDALLINEPQS